MISVTEVCGWCTWVCCQWCTLGKPWVSFTLYSNTKIIKNWDEVIFRFQRELAFAEEIDRLEAGSSCVWYCNCMAAL